jgi:hypothetical protein
VAEKDDRDAPLVPLETMRNVCTDDLPDDLNALVGYDFKRPIWRVFILSENSH